MQSFLTGPRVTVRVGGYVPVLVQHPVTAMTARQPVNVSCRTQVIGAWAERLQERPAAETIPANTRQPVPVNLAARQALQTKPVATLTPNVFIQALAMPTGRLTARYSVHQVYGGQQQRPLQRPPLFQQPATMVP